MNKKTESGISSIIVPILYGILAIAIVILVCLSGQYPYGSETMNHIYCGDTVYNSLKNGNILTMYDPTWYNGIEFFRNVAPVPAYLLAMCQAIAGGNPLNGYLVFVGLTFFIGAISWFIIGKKRNRVIMGAYVGLLWFFLPNNLYMMFYVGDLAHAICMLIVPFLVSGVYDYLNDGNWKNVVKIIISFALITLTDLEYLIFFAIGTTIFMLIHSILQHKWMRFLHVLTAMIFSFFMVGIWSVPAIVRGVGNDNVETMDNYFQSILQTINPIQRFQTLNDYFYFGFVALLLTIFGLLCAKKKLASGFIFAIVILLSTASTSYYVARMVPGKEYFMMCQYISFALCFVIYGFLMWDTLKRYIAITICILLLVEVIPSLDLIYGTLNGVSVEQRYDDRMDSTIIDEAKEVCQQRMALLDGNELESTGIYLVSAYDEKKFATFGGEWDYATTDSNISQLNRALNNGFYEYIFDRCKELGNDTVLIKVSQLNTSDEPEGLLDSAAEKCGYQLISENEEYRLYDIDVEGNWGVVSEYNAIGIGEKSNIMSLAFPAIEEVSSANLNDYTFEELSKYKLIFLSGFTYNDKQEAEELVVKLSEAGVRIVIMADGIPEDSSSHTYDFLGITCNDIAFSNGYPLLDTRLGILDCDYFPAGNEEWNTVYVNGLDEVWGTVKENDLELDFYGTVENDNIIVVGLNIIYYYSITQDQGVGELLSDVTNIPIGEIPEREIVPLTVQYGSDSITIMSKGDKVNTTLAYLDMFETEQKVEVENNILYVNEGTTVIKFGFPYLVLGCVTTVLALGVLIPLVLWIRKSENVKEEVIDKEE